LIKPYPEAKADRVDVVLAALREIRLAAWEGSSTFTESFGSEPRLEARTGYRHKLHLVAALTAFNAV
jgi:hypothetical protein